MSTDVGSCTVWSQRFSPVQAVYIPAFHRGECGISSYSPVDDGDYYMLHSLDRMEDSEVNAPDSCYNRKCFIQVDNSVTHEDSLERVLELVKWFMDQRYN